MSEPATAPTSARRALILTVSTRAAAGVYADEAGPAIAAALSEAGWVVGEVVVVPDGRATVAATLRELCERADLVVTNGGTGLSPTDETPEATADVADRVVPGIAEAMRAAAAEQTPMGMLSRATAAVRDRSLIVNLPGSPRGAAHNLSAVLPVLGHAVDQIAGGDHPR